MDSMQQETPRRSQTPTRRNGNAGRQAMDGDATLRRRQSATRQPSATRGGADMPQRGGSSSRRPARRAAGVEPARRGPNRHQPRPPRAPEPDYDYDDDFEYDDELEEDYDEFRPAGAGASIPLIPAVVVLLVCIAASVFITRTIVLRTEGADAGTQAAASSTQTTSSQGSATGTTASSGDATATTTDATVSSDAATTSSSGTFKAQPGNGVKSPWTTSGTFTSGDATLDEEVKDFCDGIATSDMGQDTAALEVYKGISWSLYVERDDAQNPSGKDWRIEYARKYYEHDNSGNCYEFAAFLGYCLQYLGFDDAIGEAVIVQLQSGDWGDHGLVFVTNTDGSKCLCDTSLGTNGWMLPISTYNYEIKDFENVSSASGMSGTSDTSDYSDYDETGSGTGTTSGTSDYDEYGTTTTGYDSTGYGTDAGTTTTTTTGTTGYGTGIGTTTTGYDATGTTTTTTGGGTGTTTTTTSTY